MAQVSDTAPGTQEALQVLQTGSSNRRDSVRNREETIPNGNAASQVQKRDGEKTDLRTQSSGDQVQLGPEGRLPEREVRTEAGSRNEDNLRPVNEQRENERGSAQVLENLEKDNARGVRTREDTAIRNEPEEPVENEREIQSARAQAQAREAEVARDRIQDQATERKNADVQLREFQTKDQVRIEPRSTREVREDLEARDAKNEAAREPLLDVPSQKVISGEAAESQPRTTGQSNVLKKVQESEEKSQSPASVQTERGLNIDDLV